MFEIKLEMEKKISSPSDCEVRAVIRFFYLNGERPVDIFQKLYETYGDFINQRDVTRWCKRFSEGEMELHDLPQSGRRTIKTPELTVMIMRI